MPERPLSVGVELEALALNANNDDPEVLLDMIAGELQQNRIKAQVRRCTLPPKTWGVGEDASVEDLQAQTQGQAQGQGQGQGQVAVKTGVEFISPAWSATASSRDAWHREIGHLLDVVSTSDFRYEVNPTAGLHVHAGTGVGGSEDSRFTLEEAKKVVKLFVACERAPSSLLAFASSLMIGSDVIEGFLALHRSQGSYRAYIQSNANVPNFKNRPARTINETVDNIPDFDALYDLVNPGDPETVGRYYKLNLRSLARHHTLEFRQHQATLSAVEVCAWADFVLAFIRHALGLSDRELAALTASKDRCRKLVETLRALTGFGAGGESG